MPSKFKPLVAILLGILPVNLFMIWYRLTQTSAFTLTDMLVWPVVIGGGNILVILALNRFLLKEQFKSLESGKGTLLTDILWGVGLAAICLVILFIEQATFSQILPRGEPPSQEVIDMMTGLARNPLLLAIWLGPVVWIGVALFEELVRVFFMVCLWKLWDHKVWKISAIILVAVFTGLIHLYQGAFGIFSVSLQGLVIGFWYYRYRRLWPLVISHALYDSVQVIGFVMQTGG
jgi:membrane protease YdiL (CAAX protease family)